MRKENYEPHDPKQPLPITCRSKCAGADAAVAFGDFGLERLNTDGNPDPGFGKAGGVITAFNSKFFGAALTSLAVQTDGKILAVGVATDGTLALARYLP